MYQCVVFLSQRLLNYYKVHYVLGSPLILVLREGLSDIIVPLIGLKRWSGSSKVVCQNITISRASSFSLPFHIK